MTVFPNSHAGDSQFSTISHFPESFHFSALNSPSTPHGVESSSLRAKMASNSRTHFLYVLSLFITICYSPNFILAQQSPSFKCNSNGATCRALVDYVTINATTLSAIRNIFNIKNLRSILGANNLPLSTRANFPVEAGMTTKIPFPCSCANGTGLSNRTPIYTVVPGDGLDHIARDVFSGLVTYQQIQAANNIPDPNIITVGMRLWIPIPCSCDDVDGQQVVHYGYVVPLGSSVEGIAQQYNTTEETLLSLNNLSRAENLLAGAVFDVPLRACSSNVSNSSVDYPLLVANNTYVFTSGNCVMCSCNAAMSWMLQCEPSQINLSCSPIRCDGVENLYLGNTTSAGCNRTTCAYAGYHNQTVLTTLDVESTCPRSSAPTLRGWRWNEAVIFIHVLLLSSSLLFVI